MSIALGNWGDLQIELICPHGEGESTWHQFLRQRGGGLHHISVWTSTFDDLVNKGLEQRLQFEARGALLNGTRYAYFQTPAPDLPLLEISQVTEVSAGLFTEIRTASINWDGSDPVHIINL